MATKEIYWTDGRKPAAFLKLESAPLKLDWDNEANWALFDPNELQRFAQRKGGFMKKRRGKVLKRLCRSTKKMGIYE